MNTLILCPLLLIPIVFSGLIPKTTTVKPIECDIVPISECTVTCGGGWKLMRYACVEQTDVCMCPPNPIYYQCNNRPCLGKNATLLDVFYDAEDQNAEEAEVEYVVEDGQENTVKKA